MTNFDKNLKGWKVKVWGYSAYSRGYTELYFLTMNGITKTFPHIANKLKQQAIYEYIPIGKHYNN